MFDSAIKEKAIQYQEKMDTMETVSPLDSVADPGTTIDMKIKLKKNTIEELKRNDGIIEKKEKELQNGIEQLKTYKSALEKNIADKETQLKQLQNIKGGLRGK